jgi:hypothetical protein
VYERLMITIVPDPDETRNKVAREFFLGLGAPVRELAFGSAEASKFWVSTEHFISEKKTGHPLVVWKYDGQWWFFADPTLDELKKWFPFEY